MFVIAFSFFFHPSKKDATNDGERHKRCTKNAGKTLLRTSDVASEATKLTSNALRSWAVGRAPCPENHHSVD